MTERSVMTPQEKRQLKQNFRDSGAKRTTTSLVVSCSYGVLTTAHRVSEVVRGEDTSLVGAARTLSRRRRFGSGVGLATNAGTLALNTSILVNRLKSAPSDVSPIELRSTGELRSNAIGAGLVMALTLGEIARGKTTFRGFPLSRAGRARNVVSLAVTAQMLVECAQELYRRSPELQQRAAMVKLMAPIMAKQTVAKVLRRKPKEPTVEEQVQLIQAALGLAPEGPGQDIADSAWLDGLVGDWLQGPPNGLGKVDSPYFTPADDPRDKQ